MLRPISYENIESQVARLCKRPSTGEGWGEGEPFAVKSPLPRWERARVRVNVSPWYPIDNSTPSNSNSSSPTDVYYHHRCTHFWSQIDGSGQLSSRETTRGIRTNTLKASTDIFKIIETIDDRTGGKNRPVLIVPSSRRKQCPLPPPPPARLSRKGTRLSRGGGNPWVDGSSYLDRAGSVCCIKGWSRRTLQSPQCKSLDSTRIDTGQSSLRGRARCLTHFIAWERRRREPGSNSVIVTASLTRCEGHVEGRGGLQRVRKIFAGCPAIRPFWDQSPALSMRGFETVGNRLYPLHGQNSLCRHAAEAKTQDRSRKKTGLNTAPGFLRVKCPFREAKGARKRSDRGLHRHSRAGGNPEKNKAHRLTSPLPRWERPRAYPGLEPGVRVTPREMPPTSFPRNHPSFPRGLPRTLIRGREPREKQSTPATPPFAGRKGREQAKPKGPTRERGMPGSGQGEPGPNGPGRASAKFATIRVIRDSDNHRPSFKSH